MKISNYWWKISSINIHDWFWLRMFVSLSFVLFEIMIAVVDCDHFVNYNILTFIMMYAHIWTLSWTRRSTKGWCRIWISIRHVKHRICLINYEQKEKEIDTRWDEIEFERKRIKTSEIAKLQPDMQKFTIKLISLIVVVNKC